MKKNTTIIGFLILLSFFIFIGYLFIMAFKIENPKPETCVIQTETIIKITEGTSKDIVFSDNQGDHYYINRGLERGLNLDSLHAKVLNKTVTLHLPKVLGGMATSEHIAQLTIGKNIIFSEFK